MRIDINPDNLSLKDVLEFFGAGDILESIPLNLDSIKLIYFGLVGNKQNNQKLMNVQFFEIWFELQPFNLIEEFKIDSLK